MSHASDELKRLRSLISDLDAIVWEADPETYRFSFVSERASEILGYTPGEWLRDPEFWGDHIHPDDRAATIERCRAAVAVGHDYDVEYRFIGADGDMTWIRDLVHVVKDERGRPTWLRGLMVDVTRQKLAELRLAEAETKYRTLVERLPAIVYVREGDATISGVSYISPQVEALLGYFPHEWMADPELWERILHPDDRRRVLAQLERAVKTSEPFASEYRAFGSSGEVVWFRDEAVPIRDPQGLVLSWHGVMLDISAHRRAEEKLQGAERRYRTLVEDSPVVTYLDEFAEDGATIYISPQVETLLGHPSDEWVGDPTLWSRTLHPQDRDWVLADARRHDRTMEPYSIEYRMLARDGTVVWVHDWAVVVHDDSGGPKYWQGVLVDITGEKRSEELQEALQAERESTDRLREVDELKNTLLQAVAHDLKTPLAAILGLAVTLEREDLELEPAEARDMASRIAVNARKLDKLVSDLLDLDRLGRGIVEPHMKPVDIGALIWDQVSDTGLFRERRVHLDTQPLVVDVDRAMIERIVENLVSNTIRHTPPGSSVWIRLAPQEGGVLIAVEDDGPGVPEHERERIFEPFNRAAGTQAVGVGVGLALVARFAELHGGRAWVTERESGGASFRVFLSGRAGPESQVPEDLTKEEPEEKATPKKSKR